jgi:N4-(beta-N-acetylglucosaminyl)-L-asparaginase
MSLWSRRKFFLTSLAGTAAAGTTNLFAEAGVNGKGATFPVPGTGLAAATGKRPVMISSANGVHALQKGMDILTSGGDTLEAAVAAVTVVEDDPNDDSVGYGGLPNEEGEVELDASVMHGPTRRAGSVASVRRIANVARLAKTVMERTNHTMIVGDGARRFAVAEGFEEKNLLTEHSRKIWLAWKASTSFNWRPGIDSPEWNGKAATRGKSPLDSDEFHERLADICGNDDALMARALEVIKDPPTGTINCLAVNEKGEISGTTTTSGLSWKIPGRVGDSPIIGAGLFVDGDVGGAGSTGKGEENIKISGGHTIVEMMRKGMSPTDACLEALHRVARNYNNDKKKLGTFHIYFYALNKDGSHGSASLWRNGYEPSKRAKYAVHDGGQGRLEECAAYFDEVGGGE